MNSNHEMDLICEQLRSTKVTERKKAAENFLLLLKNERIINNLNKCGESAWSNILSSVHSYLRKEADKAIQDRKKKGTPIKVNGSIFYDTVEIVIREGRDYDVQQILKHIVDCLEDEELNECFSFHYINTLQTIMLPKELVRGQIEPNDWNVMFKRLKNRFDDESMSNWKLSKDNLESISHFFKYGPLHGFSPELLRDQFDFVTKLCENVTKSSPRRIQLSIVEIVYHLCLHTAKDSRISCCKLGEDTFSSLAVLYEIENPKDDGLKILLTKYLLLQIILHNPNGVPGDHPGAYACSREKWFQCLKYLQKKCTDDITHNVRSYSHFDKLLLFFNEKDQKYLQKDFTRLFTEVLRQIHLNSEHNGRQLLIQENKKMKMVTPIMELIDLIEQSPHWPWINVLCTLIKTYPDMLKENDFIQLLQILSKLQIDCKDNIAAHHIYWCLSLLENMQSSLGFCDNLDIIEETWNVIRDTTLRAFGLNQNDPYLHHLLQKLILRVEKIDPDCILRSYTTQVLNVTENNLNMLNTIFSTFSIPQNASQNQVLINWILNKNNHDDPTLLSNVVTAKVLVGLMTKKWPNSAELIDISDYLKTKHNSFQEIANISLKTVFEETLLNRQSDEVAETISNTQKVVLLDRKLSAYMVQCLKEHVQNSVNGSEVNKLFREANTIGLIRNIVGYLIQFKLTEANELQDNNIFLVMLKTLFESVNEDFNKLFTSKHLDDLKIEYLEKCLDCFRNMFSKSFETSFEEIFRTLVPTDLLKTIIRFLNVEDEIDHKDTKLQIHDLRIMIVKCLTAFSCGVRNFCDNEAYMFFALAEFDYTLDEYSKCDLALTFIRSIKRCKEKTLSLARIEAILTLLFKICKAKYKYYSIACEILDFIHHLLPFVASNGDDHAKSVILEILRIFHSERHNYGSKFLIHLVNCIGILYQIDPECKFAKWDNTDVILKLPEFICVPHQEVRFATLKNLLQFFELSTHRRSLVDYHLQEIMFANICDKCEKVFEVKGELNDERLVDETITRSAVVLHILSSIFAVSTLWREESLFALLKIVHERRLESFPKVLKLIAVNLGVDDGLILLEKYLRSLLNLWIKDGKNLNDFPISLFNCDKKVTFYTKYLSDVVPSLIQSDPNCLIQIAEYMQEPVAAVLENTLPIICTSIITSNVSNLTADIFRNDDLAKLLLQNMEEEKLKSLFLEKIDEIILNLLSILKDEGDFAEKFQVSVMFTKSSIPHLNLENFRQAMAIIEEMICMEVPLIRFLFTDHVDKLQRIMMQLNISIYDSIATADKLRIFHHYTIINELILENFDMSGAIHYFIRDTCFVLLRFIKNYKIHPELGKLALLHFKKCVVTFVQYSDILCKHFVHIVTTLVDNVLEKNQDVVELSLSLLNFLIIENGERFEDIIKHMDNFPEEPNLKELHAIQSKIKYGDRETYLKDEIFNFVNFGSISKNCSSKADSLNRLQLHLFCEKRQLKNLYSQLSELNGFSEDCENSLLHRLISLLVELSVSNDKNISTPALKCLGELGPSDLMTLVIKPEKRLSYINSTPFEFFSGQIISLLSMYLVDTNIQLMRPSAEILYNILNTKEGRKIMESNEDFGYGPITSEYLLPFIIIKKPKSANFKVNIDQLMVKMNSEELWSPSFPIEYYDWLRVLVCNILETVTDSYIPQLINICRLKVEFCEVLLPSLVYLLVSLNNNEVNRVLTEQINTFFEKHWVTMNDTNEAAKKDSIVTNKKAVQVMMNVVHFVRVNKSNMKLKKNMEELDLNYLKIAKAAQYCSAYFTSLLYVELWCHSKREMLTTDSGTFKNTLLDFIQETESEDVSLAVVNILRSSYKAIGDRDSLHGTSLLLNSEHRVEYYKDSEMQDQVLLLYNMQISRGVPSDKKKLMESLKHFGLYEMTLCVGDQPDYECMWRLSDWTLPDIKVENKRNHVKFEDQMEKYKYFALKNVHERDVTGVMEHIENARETVKEKLKHTSLESSSNLYNILSYLQGFNEIENFLNAESTDDIDLLIKKWNYQDEIDKHNFFYIEPVITQRITILNDYFRNANTENHSFFKNHLIELSLKLSERARLENKTHIGIRALSLIQHLPDLNTNERTRISLEDAELCKATNNMKGRKILNQIAGDENIDPKLRSLALKLNGEWSIECYSENPNSIIQNYLNASLLLCKDTDTNNQLMKSIVKTYGTLAKFADKQYQEVSAHIASDIFQKKMKNMQLSSEMAKQLGEKKTLNVDEKKARTLHDTQSSIDQAEIEATKCEKNNFLKLALKFYLRNLSLSEENDLQIFRIMALFLENRTSGFVKELINEHIARIPSHKFLVILPQLTPHITNKNSEDYFSQQARIIIERCAETHPFHTLPVIMALANSHKDMEYNKLKTKLTTNEERINEAKKMIKSLKTNPSLVDIITNLEILSDALVELAYFSQHINSRVDKKFEIPKKCKILKIKNFTSIPVLTDNIPVNKSGNYENIVGISSFEKYYELVGGLNAPKKIICIGTDGKPREQLVKGQDDLRQDAVMQQVFHILNTFLSLNKNTSGLKIRTYKIIPLSMRSGILEWAKNTMPVGVYLTGDDKTIGAHQQYRPCDKSPGYCRKLIADASKRKPEERLDVFNRVCENFKPVFHKFFEDNFLHPTVWYERRRAYIHSVATSSMCGYILGIGDRHVSNILIDKTTAEVVHIDFGIAFEQGRSLPTPETVPFRLSRDFVDAMGVSGVEGAFRRSCEKTMGVMRENYQTILAILGVLLYDPLYSWTVSTAEANRRQRSSDDSMNIRSLDQSEGDNSVNTTAERALLRLKAKLQGIEDGTPMSVERQVDVLIHQAMDPANLSKLFHGWQAYL